MKERFIRFAEKNRLIDSGDRVLLAVSGGIDSIVMATLFLDTGISSGIAHCNFCLRGHESDLDEELVRDFALKAGIPFFSMKFDTKRYASENGISIQMAARDLRYKWFEEVRSEQGFSKVAIAHNLNDNIETLLINLTRGTGISGLTGMKVATGAIIRPLLFATRQEIAEFCSRRKIAYREDQSNAETKYTRNKIRHKIIPILKEINPSVESALNETAARLAGINEIVSDYIINLKKQLTSFKEEQIIFDRKKILVISDNESIIFELFNEYGISGPGVNDLINVIKGNTGGMIITSTHRILRNREEIVVSPNKREGYAKAFNALIETPSDLLKTEIIKSAVVTDYLPDFSIPKEKNVACLDFEMLRFPLKVRKWKEGDYFYPLGMKKKKKLSDYFIDRKISLLEKERFLVLESEGEIAWIIGERIDDRFRIKGSTKMILKIDLEH